MNSNLADHSVALTIDVPLTDILYVSETLGETDSEVLPLAASISLARQYRAVRLDLIAKRLEADEPNDLKPTAEMTLSEFMAFEAYRMPAAWADPLDEVLREAAQGYQSGDLLRVGPQDVGGIIDEMAGIYGDGGDDATAAVREFVEFRHRLAAFEIDVINQTEAGDKASEMPLARLARQTSNMEGLGFEERRRAATEVSNRLHYELEQMKIGREQVLEEASLRSAFFQKLHDWVNSEEFPPQ